jgi:hypothetical protein
MERRWSKDDFDKGDEVSGLRTGGGFGRRGGGLRGFEPPKSTSGDAAPKLNRAGKNTGPIEPLKNAEKKTTYDIERPFLREGDTPRRFQHGNKQSEGLTKEELGRIGDVNIAKMREKQAREQEPRAPKPPDAAEIARRIERMKKFGIDPKRYGYAGGGKVKFAKGGMVREHTGDHCRDYGK